MPVLGNEKLGLVDEAQRRREVYTRYIERRVAAVVDDAATERLIEAEVAQRVRREIRRRVAERAVVRLRQVRLRLPAEGPRIVDIVTAAAQAAQVSVGELSGPRISRRLVLARQAAMLLLGELRPELSAAQIAQVFGGRDPARIADARKLAADRVADPGSESAQLYRAARARLFAQED